MAGREQGGSCFDVSEPLLREIIDCYGGFEWLHCAPSVARSAFLSVFSKKKENKKRKERKARKEWKGKTEAGEEELAASWTRNSHL